MERLQKQDGCQARLELIASAAVLPWETCVQTRGGGGQMVKDIEVWDFSCLCFVCGPLRVRSRWTNRSGFDVRGARMRLRASRTGITEIRDGRLLAGLLHCTQQAEVITHMGGSDSVTSCGSVSFFLLCCENNGEAHKEEKRKGLISQTEVL